MVEHVYTEINLGLALSMAHAMMRIKGPIGYESISSDLIVILDADIYIYIYI